MTKQTDPDFIAYVAEMELSPAQADDLLTIMKTCRVSLADLRDAKRLAEIVKAGHRYRELQGEAFARLFGAWPTQVEKRLRP